MTRQLWIWSLTAMLSVLGWFSLPAQAASCCCDTDTAAQSACCQTACCCIEEADPQAPVVPLVQPPERPDLALFHHTVFSPLLTIAERWQACYGNPLFETPARRGPPPRAPPVRA